MTLVAAALGYFVANAQSDKRSLRRHAAVVDQLRTNATTLTARAEFQRAVMFARKESAFPPADVDATLAGFGARIRSASAIDFTVDFSKTALANQPDDVAKLLAGHLESNLENLDLHHFSHRLNLMAIGRRIWTADDLIVIIDVIIPGSQQNAYVRVLLIDQQ